MTPPKPPSLPGACTECTSTLQLAAPGSTPTQIGYSMARSATGQMRVDYGATSVITNPATGVTLLLDHAKQEVRAIPTPPGMAPPQLTPPGIAGMPAPPTPPTAPGMQVKDLGIKMVQGVEVQGKQITLPPLAAPKPPAPPQVPGVPGAPAPPAIPKPPQVPTIAETWVSTKLQMPVLTRITGSFGQQMCHCKNTVAGEPPPTAFQVPPNYKQVGLPSTPPPPGAPAPPAVPWAPAMPAGPKIPGAPAMPAAPAIPAAPKIPGMPAIPATPAAPAAPAMPTPPKPPTFKF